MKQLETFPCSVYVNVNVEKECSLMFTFHVNVNTYCKRDFTKSIIGYTKTDAIDLNQTSTSNLRFVFQNQFSTAKILPNRVQENFDNFFLFLIYFYRSS